MTEPNGSRWTDLLICPACGGGVRASTDSLRCLDCASEYPVRDGIPCFSSPDTFYDAYAHEHCPFAASPQGWKRALLTALPFWSWREWQFWRETIPRCDRLLDFGCGRGRELFLERAAETVGYDGSLEFLRDCATRYSRVVLGQLPRLPFASASFDVVASSHTIGHVASEHKEELVSEIARVLRPGGTSVHIIETDATHPAVSAAKRHPEVYRRQFIEQHGHIGLEVASRVIERFERRGFRVDRLRVVDALIPSALNYERFFNVPELAELSETRWSRGLWRLANGGTLTNLMYEFGFGLFHRSVEQWFGDRDRAQFIHVAFAWDG